MINILSDTGKVKDLYKDSNDTMILSCLEGKMGKIYVTDINNPRSACAFLGCFAFYAGEVDIELSEHRLGPFVIKTPISEKWKDHFEKDKRLTKRIRYATKKDTVFYMEKLRENIDNLPAEYEIKEIDKVIYERVQKIGQMRDFVSCFINSKDYLDNGLGYVIMKGNEIVSGASSYTVYDGGIEIEIDTLPDYRRKGLALVSASALILKCLNKGIYPSWDAENIGSLVLAEKLGYEFSREYPVYIYEDNAVK